MNITVPCNYTPRSYQMPFLRAMDKGKNRACLIWHRKSGKTMTLMNFACKKAFERVGTYFHAFPEYGQGRKVVWDGRDNDGNSLLENHFPQEIRTSTNNTEMKITLVNGSIYQIIGADNYDSLVGPNPMGIILDEYAVSDRYPVAWDYFRPILAANGGWAVFVYTPRGMNHGWKLWQDALRSERWFTQLLSVEDTGAVTKERIQNEREDGMSEDMVNQEFFCSFLASTSDILIAPQLIQDALKREIRLSSVPRLAGADCARFGDDRSTLVIRQGPYIIHAESWQKLDNVQLAGKLIDRHRTKLYDAIAIDTIGMPGVFDMVKNYGIPAVPVNVAENSSRNPERFHRLRDELWWMLREFFGDATCAISKAIPESERKALIADIQDIHYSYKGLTGKILIEPKSDMKKRLGFSPDLGDALCHTFAPGLQYKISPEERSPFGFANAQKRESYNPLTFIFPSMR